MMSELKKTAIAALALVIGFGTVNAGAIKRCSTVSANDSTLYQYLHVTAGASDSKGMSIGGNGTNYTYASGTSGNYVNFTDSFVIYGIQSGLNSEYYMDVSVNLADTSSGSSFNISIANGDVAEMWYSVLAKNSSGTWTGDTDPYIDPAGWADFRIFMEKDSESCYVKSIYNKDAGGAFRRIISPEQVTSNVNWIEQDVTNVSYLTVTGAGGTKIRKFEIHNTSPKDLIPGLLDYSFADGSVSLTMNMAIDPASVTADTVQLYDMNQTAISNASFSTAGNVISITCVGKISKVVLSTAVRASDGQLPSEAIECKSYQQSGLKLCDGNGTLLTAAAGTDTAAAKMTVKNYYEENDSTETVAVAAYDSTGKLIKADAQTKPIGVGQTDFSATVGSLSNSGCARIKAFLWKNAGESMMPLGKPVTVPGTQTGSAETLAGIYDATILAPSSDYAYVRGKKMKLSEPQTINGVMLISVDDIADILVTSEEKTNDGAQINYLTKEISFKGGSSIMTVTDRADDTKTQTEMSAAAAEINGKIYVPVKAVLAATGQTVNTSVTDYIIFGDGKLSSGSLSSENSLIIADMFADNYSSGTVMSTLYVDAVNGSDSGSGSIGDPFRTIDEASAAARSIKTDNGMTGDIKIYLRGGTYYTGGISLTADDSGENGYKVRYIACTGETPKVISGEKVTGWTRYSGNIYRAYVGRNDFKYIIENGADAHPARYPNSGYNSSPSDSGNNTTLTFTAGDVPTLAAPQKARVSLWPGNLYRHDWCGVSSIDYTNHKINLSSSAGLKNGAGTRYFIENDMNILDEQGEFYTSDDGYLYYIPYGSDIADSEIIIPSENNILTLSGNSYKNRIRGISFSKIEFYGADRDHEGIYIKNGSDITIDSCKFENIGSNAVCGYGSFDISVNGCSFENIGKCGVVFKGDAVAGKVKAGYSSVTGNKFKNVGTWEPYFSAGVFLYSVDDCRVSNNKISAAPANGIHVMSDKSFLKNGTIDQSLWDDYIRGHNNTIEYNDISETCKDSMDVGAIYFYNTGTGNIIRDNYIHDNTSPISYWFPLYIDDGSDGTAVCDNIIADNQTSVSGGGYIGSLFFIKGTYNKVYNNIGFANQNYSGADKNYNTVGTLPMASFTNNNITIKRNIFEDCGNRFIYIPAATTTSGDNIEDRLAAEDYNIHYNTSGIYLPNVSVNGITTIGTWKAWQSSKYDAHSLFGTDPLMSTPADGDFRLAYSSDGYSLGFRNTDIGNAGLKNGFVFTDTSDALDRVYITDNKSEKAFAKLSDNETLDLTLFGRTVNGYYVSAEDAAVKFTSSDASVASVSSDGIVTANSKGTAVITAQMTYNNTVKTIAFTVYVDEAVHTEKGAEAIAAAYTDLRTKKNIGDSRISFNNWDNMRSLN